jgi:hypothetical protein
VPIDDDEQFERYLRQFRPLSATRMQFENLETGWRRTLPVWAAVAAVALVAWLMLHPRGQQSNRKNALTPRAGVVYIANSQPLTIQSADALLTRAPSFEAAIDALAAPSHVTSFDGKQSAFDALSKDPNL